MAEIEHQQGIEHEEYEELPEIDLNTLKRGDKLLIEMVQRDETEQKQVWATLTIDVTGVRKDGLRVHVKMQAGKEYEKFTARLIEGMTSPVNPPGPYRYAFTKTPGIVRVSTNDEVTAVLFPNRKYLASSDKSTPIGSTAAAAMRVGEISLIKKLIK